jgi:hypothetical protein
MFAGASDAALLLIFLKLYLIAGQCLMVVCLHYDNSVVRKVRQVGSLPLVLVIAMVSIALWPLAFAVRKR